MIPVEREHALCSWALHEDFLKAVVRKCHSDLSARHKLIATPHESRFISRKGVGDLDGNNDAL